MSSSFERKQGVQQADSSVLAGRQTVQRSSAPVQGAVARIRQLQQTIGNRAVGRLLHPEQTAEVAVPTGEGRPMSPKLRSVFEERFGADFRKVRIHASEHAAESARALDAVAYTVGTDVVFDAGKFNPNSKQGEHLLAHELAHVVQQSRGGDAPQSFNSGSGLEQEAAQAATQFSSGVGPVSVSGASSTGIARQESKLFGKKLYPHTVTFKNQDEFIASDAGTPWTFNPDGTVTATRWLPYPQSALVTPHPTPPAAKPVAKPVAKPKAPEPPTDIRLLREIVEALQPRLIYPKPVRQFFGGLQFLGGGLEAGIGGVGGLLTSETGVGLVAGGFLLLHGADVASSGWETMLTGEQSHTYTFRIGRGLALSAGADPRIAQAVGESSDIIATIGSAGLTLVMPLPPVSIALSPEAELDLELSRLANLEARPRFGAQFDPQWQDIAEGVLTPEGYRLNPRLQDLESMITSDGKIVGKNFGGKYMYVVDEQGVIRIGTRAQQHMPHPTLIGGVDPFVRAAGEIDIRGGQIYSINNLSGHFRPTPESLGTMYGAFSRLPDTAFRPGFLGFRVFYF
jgi:hypothetical protein